LEGLQCSLQAQVSREKETLNNVGWEKVYCVLYITILLNEYQEYPYDFGHRGILALGPENEISPLTFHKGEYDKFYKRQPISEYERRRGVDEENAEQSHGYG
jgi:hypothetical protein